MFDKSNGPGPDACSWWAGGMLAPWCERESAEQDVVRFGEEAAAWWDRHTGAVTHNGSLVVALGRDRSELKRFARRTDRFEAVGAEQIAELEPDLEGRFSSGLYFASEAHLTPRDVVTQLVNGLTAAGTPINYGYQGETLPNADLTFDCRGLAARDELNDLRGVKGEMVMLRCPDVTLRRPVRLLHPRIPLYIVPRGEGVFMVGATMIESDERHRISARSMLSYSVAHTRYILLLVKRRFLRLVWTRDRHFQITCRACAAAIKPYISTAYIATDSCWPRRSLEWRRTRR